MKEDKKQIVGQMCDDNRFELIEKYKQKLIKATNIETAKDETKVLDNVLFRFWQMGWLDILEEKEIAKKEKEIAKKVLEKELGGKIIV